MKKYILLIGLLTGCEGPPPEELCNDYRQMVVYYPNTFSGNWVGPHASIYCVVMERPLKDDSRSR